MKVDGWSAGWIDVLTVLAGFWEQATRNLGRVFCSPCCSATAASKVSKPAMHSSRSVSSSSQVSVKTWTQASRPESSCPRREIGVSTRRTHLDVAAACGGQRKQAVSAAASDAAAVRQCGCAAALAAVGRRWKTRRTTATRCAALWASTCRASRRLTSPRLLKFRRLLLASDVTDLPAPAGGLQHLLKPMSDRTEIPKSPTGIQGLDELTGGGLPRAVPPWSAGRRLRRDPC